MNTRFCPVCRRNFGTLNFCPQDGAPLRQLPDTYPDPGTVIDGEFELQSGIAVGGMSRIYRAMWLGQGRHTAAKVLDPRLGAHPYTVDRFYREARVALLLEHENCVTVHTFGPTRNGHHVIVMELLGGESLGQILRREGKLSWPRAARVLMELCDALGHAHGRRVIHRDIKPDNIQLMGDRGPDERIKLLDFGIAYVSADSRFSEAAPGSTNVSGTPAYMSPEQIRGTPLDGRSDIYSLGVLLFEMLTGRRPFGGDDPVAVCRAQLYEKPPPLDALLAEDAAVPAELTALCRELLAKSRRSRVPSVGALLTRISTILPDKHLPTRFRRNKLAKPRPTTADRLPRARSGVIRSPTGEFLVPAPQTMVTVLQIQLESPNRSGTGTTAWPKHVDEVLAGWKALVEESGGLVQQPDIDTIRAVFGLFTPSRRAADVWHAVLHAVRLRELFDQNFHSSDERLAMKGCVVRVETIPGELTDVNFSSGVPPEALSVITALLKAAPPGTIAVEETTRDLIEDFAIFKSVSGAQMGGGQVATVHAIVGIK